MASNDKPKPSRFDFQPWAGVSFVVDPNMQPDTFYFDPLLRCFRIGAGTDLELRLFALNLTREDRSFLRGIHVKIEE